MQKITKNWNFIRLLRLAMGVFLTVEALKTQMWLLVAVGVWFTLMPILNIGCCSTNSCAIPNTESKHKDEEIEFEEIK